MNPNLTIPITSLLPTFSDVLLAENPLAIIHKITGGLCPSRIRVEINDKLAKVIFKLSDEGTDDLLNGNTFCIVERHNKKFGEITTAYKILNSAGYQVLRPFTMFDRFVLAVCISEWIKGNRYTTVAIIYRALTGKISRSDAKPSVTQRKAIIESLEILMSRIVDYDAEEVCQVMSYNNGNPFVAKAPLLPATYIDFSAISGDSDTLIFFTDEPHGRQVLPKRWIIERTFAWLNHSRRLSKDYELTVASAETLIKISHIHTLLKRL